MRNFFRALSRRMVVKVFLAVALVTGEALMLLGWRQNANELEALRDGIRTSARSVADLVVGGIAFSMLQGEGIQVKELVRRIRERLPDADIRIYDPQGLPVFGEKVPAPRMASLPAELAAALADGQRRVADGMVFQPIANEKRCRECHDAGLLRGVLAMKTVPLALSHARETTLSRLVRDGFVRVMTARQSEKLDAYFEELSRNAPALAAVAVYDAKGRLRFGSRPASLPPDALERALRPGAASELLPAGQTIFSLVPLPMEERCEQCHKADVPVRGALVLAFRPAPGANPAAELESVVDTSLRTIMLSNLGRMITGFLMTVADTGAVASVALYDDAGRTYFTSAPGVPDALVSKTLSTVQPAVAFVGRGRSERVLVAQPLPNEHACVRCHGSGSVRGVVTVSLSSGVAADAQEAALRRTAIGTALTLAALLAVLYFLLQKLVIEPVQEIGAAADAVGDGNLDVVVRSARADGDEMKRLGSRVNQMVQGLRAKTVLERFVSRGTAAAAHGAASHATSGTQLARSSTRRPMTVLFSDIRGFTGYAEGVAAEQVVELLNRFLQAQADMVERHGGDVDKFAGDELMAVFSGGEAPARAVMCAVEMLEAVASARKPGEMLGVGIGIVTGEVVYGAVGSKNRMDFTVIGDVVNTASRLCGAAQAGEILVGEATRLLCGEIPGVRFVTLPPLAVRGKREPLTVFAAEKSGA